MRTSYKVALCGIISALSVIFMSATAIFPVASLALPAIAGSILIIINLELGKKWALLCYVCISLISLFVSPDHTAVFSFIFLFGHYPVIKELIESLRKTVLEWVLKILVLNLAVAITAGATILFFGIGYLTEEYKGIGTLTAVLFIVGINAAFVIFDLALTQSVALIEKKLMPLLKKLR